MKFSTYTSISSCMLALSPVALADAAPAADNDIATVTIVATSQRPDLELNNPSATGSRLKLSVRDLPASVESVDADTMRQRGDVNVGDAITRTTGLTNIATQGDGGVAYSARGFTGNNSVGVLIDGQHMLVGAGTATDPSNTWGYERIEVLRGAGSVISGSGTTGATINAIRKAPMATASAEALLGIGAHDTRRAGLGATGALGAAGAFRLDAYNEKSAGFIDRGESASTKFMSSVRFDPHSDLRLEFQLDHNDQKPTRYWGTPLVNGAIDPALRERNYNVKDADIHYIDERVLGRAIWQASPDLQLREEVSYFTAKRHWRDAEEYAYNTATRQVDRYSFGEIYHHQRQVGNRIEAAYARQGNRLVAGWELSNIDFRHDSNGFDGSDSVALQGFDPGTFAPQGITATPNFRSQTRARAVYAEDAYDLSEQLLLVAGVRHDAYRYTRTSGSSGASFDADLASTALRLGLTYRATAQTSLYAQASTGSDPIGSLLSLNLANSKFSLTKAKQVEAGIKGSFADGLGEWTAALYRIRKSDIITRDPVHPSVSIQGGSQSSRGAEVSTSLVLGRGWRINANLALVDAQFEQLRDAGGISYAGKRPPNVAAQVANLWLAYGVADWHGGIGTRYVGKSYADNGNTMALPAYTVLDASVAWQANRQLTVRANLRNLTDRVYATTAYTSTQVNLGDPRHVELTAEFKF
ncbi:MAG: TonB-dependent receptor [Sphingomonadaceae bacterium]